MKQTIRAILFSNLKIENHEAVDKVCDEIINKLIIPLEKKSFAQNEEIKRLVILAARADEDRMALTELT